LRFWWGNVGFLSVESLGHVRVFSLRPRLQMKRTISYLYGSLFHSDSTIEISFGNRNLLYRKDVE